MKISARLLGASLLTITILALSTLLIMAVYMINRTGEFQEKSKAINDISIKVSSISTSIGITNTAAENYYPRLFEGSNLVIEQSLELAETHNLANLRRLLMSTQRNLIRLQEAFNNDYSSSYFTNLRAQIILQLSRIFEEANRQANSHYLEQNALLKQELTILSSIGLSLLFVLLIAFFIYFQGFLFPITKAQTLLKEKRYKELSTNKTLVVKELELLFKTLQHSQKQLIYDATHDDLTHLANRAEFKQLLKKAIIHNKKEKNCSALIYFDLDDFKTVNDSLGHVFGDKLLLALSKRLTGLINKQDCLARIGGDEFTLLLTDLTPRLAEDIALKKVLQIFRALKEPFTIDSHLISVSSSVGIALCPLHGNDVNTLMRNVDAALYDAKSKGKARYSFYKNELTENAEKLLKTEHEIEIGIRTDQFVMFYQPQVDARTNEVVGMEALIRWQHPERGLLPPPEFIPIAEKSYLIQELGMWIINNVLKQVALWQNQWQILPKISINISTFQLEQVNFVEQVDGLIKHHNVQTNNICFEITESTFLNHSKRTLDSIQALRERGFEFAIDDFGTGYSCLSYINRLPIDIIKIDKEFIDSISTPGLSTSPLESIIILAGGLGLKLVAEGVEERRQVDYLKQKHCHIIQGYYYSKPLPVESIVANKNTVQLPA